jgi:hypothetical protein
MPLVKDAACEEIDKKVSSEEEYTTDEEWENEQRRARADWEKERVNHLKRNYTDIAQIFYFAVLIREIYSYKTTSWTRP